MGHFSGTRFTAGPGLARTHSPVHHDRVRHVLEQLLGLKQQGDVQNHIAVSWGRSRKPAVQFCKPALRTASGESSLAEGETLQGRA